MSGSKFVHPISYLVVAFASCYTLLSLVGIEMEGTYTAATSQQASHFSCNPFLACVSLPPVWFCDADNVRPLAL